MWGVDSKTTIILLCLIVEQQINSLLPPYLWTMNKTPGQLNSYIGRPLAAKGEDEEVYENQIRKSLGVSDFDLNRQTGENLKHDWFPPPESIGDTQYRAYSWFCIIVSRTVWTGHGGRDPESESESENEGRRHGIYHTIFSSCDSKLSVMIYHSCLVSWPKSRHLYQNRAC